MLEYINNLCEIVFILLNIFIEHQVKLNQEIKLTLLFMFDRVIFYEYF